MAKVTVGGEVAAPIDEVWALVSDFVGFVAKRGRPVTGQGEGVGMTRTMPGESGDVVERLESVDDVNRTLSYSIVSAPVPVSSYLSTIRVLPAGETATHVDWSATFEPAGVTEAEAVAYIDNVYRRGLQGLQDLFV